MDLRQIYNEHMGSDYRPVEELGISKAEGVFSDIYYGDLLEVGAGNGHFGLTLLANKRVHSVTFLDVADVCIEFIWKGIHKFGLYASNYSIYRGTLEDYEFIDRVDFNAVAFFEGLEHVIDVKVAVDRIYSLLRRGGIFIGSVPVGIACNYHTHLHHFYEGYIQEVLSDKFSIVEVKTILINEELDKYHYIFKAVK